MLYVVFIDIMLLIDFVFEYWVRKGQKRKYKWNVDLEVYVRFFGEVYVCGRFFGLSFCCLFQLCFYKDEVNMIELKR